MRTIIYSLSAFYYITFNQVVPGSNPGTLIDAQIAQLVEQRTENPRVTGSIPVLGIWDISSVGRALDF